MCLTCSGLRSRRTRLTCGECFVLFLLLGFCWVLTEGAYAYAECVLLFAVSPATRLRMSGR